MRRLIGILAIVILAGFRVAGAAAFYIDADTLLLKGAAVGLGIGVSNPDTLGEIGTLVGSGNKVANIQSYVADRGGVLILGDAATTLDDNTLGFVVFTAYGQSASHRVPAYISAELDGGTANQRGGRISFYTKANGSTTISERLRIGDDGLVSIGAANPSAVLFGVETPTANSSSPLVYIHANASSGTDNQPLLKLHQDYASATGDIINLTSDAHSVTLISASIAPAIGTTVTTKVIASGAAQIADDGVATIYSGTQAGAFFIVLSAQQGGAGAPQATALLSARVASGPSVNIISQAGGITYEVTTLDVAGTTGTDARITVSIREGIVEIENRSGAIINITGFMVGS